jgi:hypothetical protein
MTVHARWHNEDHTIVRVQFSDPWTLPELSAALQEARQLLESVHYPVDAIWDGADAKTVPNNVLSHFMLSRQDSEPPANQRTLVVVARSTLLKTFVSSAKRLMPHATKNMYMTDSLDAAEQKIEMLQAAVR